MKAGDKVRFTSKHDGKKYTGRITKVQPVSGRIEISFRGPMVKPSRPDAKGEQRASRVTFAIRYAHELEAVS